MWKFLKNSQSVLGINARNLDFVRSCNFKQARQIADNKLLAKKILRKANVLVPKTYGVVSSTQKLMDFDPGNLPKSFVLKPNRGFGGEGIILTYNRRRNGSWLDSHLKEITWTDIKVHVQDIIDGRFSLANRPDIALFEERLVRDSIFKHLVYRGVPDIRVIVYNQIPVMSMMRLPTKQSSGKANLHLGAIGVGIDISSGITTYAVCRDKILTNTASYSGIKIPQWNKVLSLAVKAQQVSELGYAGIDIVLAKKKGPVVLELNARPGLSIQLANLAGLKERLLRVRGLEVANTEQAIRLTKDLFSRPANKKIKKLTKKGQKKVKSSLVLNVVETIKLQPKDSTKAPIEIKAKVDSGARSSSIDYQLARDLGYQDVVEYIKPFNLDKNRTFNQAKRLRKKIKKELRQHPNIDQVKVIKSASGATVRIGIKIFFELKGKKIESKANLISRKNLVYDMIVGRRDLKGFLIKLRQ